MESFLAPYISNERLFYFSDYPQTGIIINTVVIGFSYNQNDIKFSYVALSMKDYPL